MALQKAYEQEREVYSNESMMTDVEKTASEIIDLILEEEFSEDLSFDIKLNLMIASIDELINVLLEDEDYERCALYRDVITELKRYENGGDKAARIDQGVQS